MGTVTHVLFWTGYTVDFANASSPFYNQTLLNRVPACQQPAAAQYITARVAASLPVRVCHQRQPLDRPFLQALCRLVHPVFLARQEGV